MAKKQRVLITTNGDGKWYVRRVKFTSHDLDVDEMVYCCDLPIGTQYESVDEAVLVAKCYLGIDR